MTTTAKLYPSINSAAVKRAEVKSGKGLSFGGFITLLIKSIEMAQAIPDTGRVGAKDVEKVRRIAEAL